MQDLAILIILLLGAWYYRYGDILRSKVHDSLTWIFLFFGLIVVYFIYLWLGHYGEKLFNKITAWRLGIKIDKEGRVMSYLFKEFNLSKALSDFYKRPENFEKTFLGFSAENKNEEAVSIPDIQRSQHLQVLGMTGTGKTSGVFLPLIYQDALKKRPVIILDAKGELSCIYQLNGLLESIGRKNDFMLFSLAHKEQSCTYNPLYVGECDPQIIIDSFFDNFEDDNSFYWETSKTIFTNAFYILHSLGKPFTPMDIYAYLTNFDCRQDINKEIKDSNPRGTLYLKLLNTLIARLTDQYKGWEHVITGFNNYLLNHRDEVLNDPDSDIILTDIIRERKIVYFQLPTNAYPIQAVNLARMIQANLRYISSLIQVGQIPKDILVSIIIDEYASFAEESFVEVLNKARSSGMMVTISHQTLSDLTAISETFMKRVDENTLNKLYLKQTDPELCELIAKSMGTYIKQEKTYRMSGGKFGNQVYSGDSSDRLVNEFHFAPDKIKNLNKFGQGYFVYRGDNSHKCVNLGRFNNVQEIPYERKVKKNKREGLKLFEQYYLADAPRTKKQKSKLQLASVSDGLLECDD